MTTDNPKPLHAAVQRALPLAMWVLLGLMAAVVVVRAVAGAISNVLPDAWVLCWSLMGSAASAWAGHCASVSEQSWPRRRAWLLLGWGVGGVFGGAWLPVATPFQTGLLLGVVVLHGGLVATAVLLRNDAGETIEQAGNGQNNAQSHAMMEPMPQTAGLEVAEVHDSHDALQWMLRRASDTAEICEGRLQVQFVPGQREITLHIAFCPPLSAVPTVELEDLDGHGWELKTAAAYPYGLRLSIRRAASDIAAATGRIAYWAAAPHASHRAAA